MSINRKLLEETPESYYWIGFILADGHIPEDGHKIAISLAEKDKWTVEKFAEYVEATSRIRSTIVKRGYSAQAKNGHTIRYDIHACDKETVNLIKKKFDIHNRKTYNPPDIDWMNIPKELFMALLIGYIDGDGCITQDDNSTQIDIKIHENWHNTLCIWVDKLNKEFGSNVPYPKKSCHYPGRTKLSINYHNIRIYMKDLIIKHNLSAMKRKWDKVPSSSDPLPVRQKQQQLYDTVETMKRLGISNKNIRETVGLTVKQFHGLNRKNRPRKNKYRAINADQHTKDGYNVVEEPR